MPNKLLKFSDKMNFYNKFYYAAVMFLGAICFEKHWIEIDAPCNTAFESKQSFRNMQSYFMGN